MDAITLRAVTIVNGSDLSIEWFAVVPLLVQPQMEIIDIAHKKKVRMERQRESEKKSDRLYSFLPHSILPFLDCPSIRTLRLEENTKS
jgi:hypothetical protein